MLNDRPDKIDFILFPRRSLHKAGIDVVSKPDDSLPEFLSSRHVGTQGPRHQPDEDFFLELARDESKRIVRLTTKEIKQRARQLIEEIPALERHLGQHWPEHLREEDRGRS